ncbi:TIGR01777 family protein [Dokdonia sinensis]|uniref:TIGR01777 family protein n=1 Tax=Dokdonia sinensis TaxID=2479847 RepID=A0A3M0FX90_9FLAO|nr:TIGR01777 family oxidoreductase [Dokdonia sinensis]RMB57088.1 TIGR01777 family protein [Dokdonia sinensis]
MKKLVIAGGTGFLGSVIIKHFSTRFEEIVLLSRKRTSELHDQRESTAVKRKPNNGNVRTAIWDARTFSGWEKELDGADVLINMTGRSVDCRYNQKNRDLILNSRVDSTKILGEAVAQCARPPKVWLNSSTATIYRHSLDKEMSEATGEIGSGFSVNVATAWENAFFKSKTPATRKVALRTSIVLGKDGGALQPIKQITKMGLGGRQGNGKQKFSWIHEEDFVRSIDFILDSALEGPINIVAPKPTTNSILMKTMRETLNVPFGIPAPKPILEIGAFTIRTETELLLKSRNVIPQRLLEGGFTFYHPKLKEALNDLL